MNKNKNSGNKMHGDIYRTFEIKKLFIRYTA